MIGRRDGRHAISASDDAALTTPIVEVSHPAPRVAVVVLLGEHDLASEPDVSAAIALALDEGNDVVLDLAETLFIDSRIVGVLIKESAYAEELDRQFVLRVQTDSPARRVLEITTIDQRLQLYETVESAVEAILKARA
jgi:anti-anti-sigma factor